MLEKKDIVSFLIKKKYEEITNSDNYSDLYELTPHPLRYTSLSYALKILSFPLSLICNGVKFISQGLLTINFLNLPDIFLDKMNQGILKKILHGSPEENNEDQVIPKVVEQILKEYEEQPELIIHSKPSLIKKFTIKVNEYIPVVSKFMNFWDQGGINYQDEVQKKQPIIDLIYKKIVSEAYNVGKKGEKLEINDVQGLFSEINFEEKVESGNIKNTEKVIIVDDNKDSIACEQPPISPNSEEIKVATNFNPLVNLMMLKALHEQQEICKVYLEHCLAEYIYNNKYPYYIIFRATTIR